MKQIIKSVSPVFFEEWKAKFIAENNCQPDYREDFFGGVKHKLKEELLEEQGYICCYCMARVGKHNSHIEHFIPQSNSDKDLDYFNMFISCNGYKEDRSHCGHKKRDWFDSSVLVSPLEKDVEIKFKYLPDGTIVSTDCKTAECIKQLGLDNFALNRARKAAIDMSGIFDEELSDDLLSIYQSKDDTGRFLPFCQAVVYCILHNS